MELEFLQSIDNDIWFLLNFLGLYLFFGACFKFKKSGIGLMPRYVSSFWKGEGMRDLISWALVA